MTLNSANRGWRIAAWASGYTLAIAGGVAWLVAPVQSAKADRGIDIVQTAVAVDAVHPVVAASAVNFAEGTTFKGTVVYTDEFKTLAPLVKKGQADVKDPAVCAAADVPNEEMVVNADNKGVADVFIYLSKAPAGYKVAKPEGDVVFDQKGCQFLPHSLCVQIGQTVTVLSDDPIPHNTHTNPIRNTGFNQTIAPNDRTGVALKYTKAEKTPIEVKCDFHTWMKAYHLILDHPFMAVTDADGKFEIKDLPPGKHEFMVWHSKKGFLDRKYVVDAKAGAATEVTIKYGAKNFMAFDGPRPKSVVVSLSK